jgi:hypothetical protein
LADDDLAGDDLAGVELAGVELAADEEPAADRALAGVVLAAGEPVLAEGLPPVLGVLGDLAALPLTALPLVVLPVVALVGSGCAWALGETDIATEPVPSLSPSASLLRRRLRPARYAHLGWGKMKRIRKKLGLAHGGHATRHCATDNEKQKE